MADLNDPCVLRTVLAYDSFHHTDLTAFDRILIHQYIASGIALSHKLQDKIKQLVALLDLLEWQAPLYRYRELPTQALIVLETYIETTGTWEVLEEYKR